MSSTSDPRGLTPTELLIEIADHGSITTACDLVRHNRNTIGALASLGLITNVSREGYVTGMWRVTFKGHVYLMEHYA